MSEILDTNGRPAKPLGGPIEIVAPHPPLDTGRDEFADQMEQDLLGKVVQMPVNAHKLERFTKIKQCGDRRAIQMLFETVLDHDRVNLLMLRIYFAAENAEREVMQLPDGMVADLVRKFERASPEVDGTHGADGTNAEPCDGATP